MTISIKEDLEDSVPVSWDEACLLLAWLNEAHPRNGTTANVIRFACGLFDKGVHKL